MSNSATTPGQAVLAALRDLVEADDTPEKNCSCHLAPPCGDCVDHGLRRELIDAAKAALAQADGVAQERTPAARWRDEGKPDPTPQDYERAALPLGNYTDDELANAAYLFTGPIPEGVANAAKQRMRWLSRRLCEAEAKLAAVAALLPEAQPVRSWQARILDWAVDKFGAVARDPQERALRFIEEAIELGQACELRRGQIDRLVERVYSQPPGDPRKEMAQAGLTLEALVENLGLSLAVLIAAEVGRIQSIPKEEWQRRHQAKVDAGHALADTAVAHD